MKSWNSFISNLRPYVGIYAGKYWKPGNPLPASLLTSSPWSHLSSLSTSAHPSSKRIAQGIWKRFGWRIPVKPIISKLILLQDILCWSPTIARIEISLKIAWKIENSKHMFLYLLDNQRSSQLNSHAFGFLCHCVTVLDNISIVLFKIFRMFTFYFQIYNFCLLHQFLGFLFVAQAVCFIVRLSSDCTC